MAFAFMILDFVFKFRIMQKNAPYKEAEKSGFNERDGGFLSAFTGILRTIFSKD